MLELFKKYISPYKSSAFYYLINLILSKILNFVVTFLIINKISDVNYGQLVFFTTWVSIFLTISCLGLPISIIKDISAAANKISRYNYLGSLIIFSFIFAFFCEIFLLAFFFFYIYPDSLSGLRSDFAIFLFLNLILNIINSINIGFNNQIKSQIPETYFRLPILVILFFLIEDLTLPLILLFFNIMFFLTIILSIFLSLNNFNKIFVNFFYFKFKLNNIKIITKLGLITILSALMSRIDIIMLENFSSLKQVGVYNIAFIIGSATSIVAVSLNPFISTIVSREYASKKFNETPQFFFFSRTTLVVTSIVFLFLYNFFFKELFSNFVPSASREALDLAFYFIFFYTIIGFIHFSEIFLVMVGKENYVVKCYVFGLILNIILNYYLIQKYEAKGAIIATIVVLIILNILFYLKSKFIISNYEKNNKKKKRILIT
jgi:O-antigen/teichoic acid export membrane protein